MPWIVHIAELTREDVASAGGKGASLGELMHAGMPVPRGFVILANAPHDLTAEIFEAFDRLGVREAAVRSSATVEDASLASWAGQFETYLHVGRGDVMRAVQQCRDSANNARVQAYRTVQGMDAAPIDVAVIVQSMVQADIAGVCFTVHPVTKNPDHLIIEACEGLGDRLVSGEVTPDAYVYDKRLGALVDVFESGNDRLLSHDEIQRLVELCRRIERHFGYPCDIEWAKQGNEFFILQSRPITTLTAGNR